MRFATAVLLAALAMSPAAKADFYVVVSLRNPTTSLTQESALQLFMGRTRVFPDGQPAAPCDLASDSTRAGFYRALSGMSLAQVNSYWARLMFSGRNLPPQRLQTQAAMAEKVAGDPAAIGWLPEPPKHPGIRTVLVLRARP
jgi:hypothetical protein